MQIAHSYREREWIRNHNDTIHSGARARQWRSVRVPPHRLQQGNLSKESGRKNNKREAKHISSPEEHQEQIWITTAVFTRIPTPVT